MKNTNKGFTLVELIVVITILAILGTIAFVSLQGYSQEAKNAKVGSDLSQLASKINIVTSSKDNVLLNTVGDDTLDGVNDVTGTGAGIALTDADATYYVGKIDFTVLKENAATFKDKEGKDYVIATLSKGSTAVFTLAGQTKDSAGKYKAVIRGNYYKANTSTDVDSLISQSGSADTTALVDGVTLTATNGLY